MGLTQNLGRLSPSIFSDSSLNIGVGAAPSGSYKFEVTGTSKVSGVLTLGSTLSNGTYTYTLPSATGTLALTSDIPVVTGYVPYTGATADVNLGIYTLTASGVNAVGYTARGSGTLSGYLIIKQGTTYLGNVVGYNSINANARKYVFISDVDGTNYKSAIFELSSLTNNTDRTYTLPDANGTIALVGGSGVGTVTSVAALTLGTTGTDLSSTVATGTTTPVITLNVPTASAANRGALSSADWTTFNGKQAALTIGNITSADTSIMTISGGTGAIIGSGVSLTLLYASGTNAGIVSTTTQTFAGAKTFTSALSGTSATFSSSVSVNGNIVYINGGQPETRYTENDVGALPLGLWRTVLGGDAFYVQKNTAVAGDFSTAINCLQFANTGAATFSSSVTAAGYLISGDNAFKLNSIASVQSQQIQYQNNGTNKWQLYLNTSDNSFNIYNSAQTANNFTIASTGAATFSSTILATNSTFTTTGSPTTNGNFAGLFVSSSSSSRVDGIGIGDRGSALNKWVQSYNGALELNPVGNNVLIGTTTDNTVNKLQVNGSLHTTGRIITSYTTNEVQNIVIGNGNSQGSAQKWILVRQYSVVSVGNKLIIPFTSQGNLNSTTICKVYGHSARYNSRNPYGFEITFSVGSLTILDNLTSWGGGGNFSGISIGGMNIEIDFTTAYTSGTANGIFVTIEYMTNEVAYSIDVPNITMN